MGLRQDGAGGEPRGPSGLDRTGEALSPPRLQKLGGIGTVPSTAWRIGFFYRTRAPLTAAFTFLVQFLRGDRQAVILTKVGALEHLARAVAGRRAREGA